MARIVTVYNGKPSPFRPVDMSYIRWLKMSEALARRGHEVDIATNESGFWRRRFPLRVGERLRRVPLDRVRWERYDAVKTLFHLGFQALAARGGADHPLILSKLGSVVGASDQPGVYFTGSERERLFETQRRIAERARCVTVLTEASAERWRAAHGPGSRLLLVPGAAPAELPPEGRDPYPTAERPRCLFAGNIYDEWSQAEAHGRLVEKLNGLGARLRRAGVGLYFLGRGDTSRLAPGAVTSLGAVTYDESWDYLRRADVGVVLALGDRPNDNESTKIYHYLRVGLPTICEAGFPNEGLPAEAGLGGVTPNGDLDALAEAAAEAARKEWDRRAAIDLILRRHTWDVRAGVYDAVLRQP